MPTTESLSMLEGVRITQLWRYPVKSLGGEELDVVAVGERGVHGDRLWAVRDVERDITATARRIPALLTCAARYLQPPGPDAGPGHVPPVEITFPDGQTRLSSDPDVDDLLSEVARRRVRLTALPPVHDTSLHRLSRSGQRAIFSGDIARTELGMSAADALPHAANIPLGDLLTLARFSTPPGTFVDLAPIHLLTETSLATIAAEVGDEHVDPRRFRPNIIVAVDNPRTGLPEADWLARRLSNGDTSLRPFAPTIRCVVPSRAQPELPVDRRITKALATCADRYLGVYVRAERPGTLRVGDSLDVTAIGERRLDWAATAVGRIKRVTLTAAQSILSLNRRQPTT